MLASPFWRVELPGTYAGRRRSLGTCACPVRGKGLFRGIELVTDRDSKEPAVDVARRLPDRMREVGILIGLSGRFGNVLKIRPPLVFSKENVDELVQTLDRVLP